MKLAGEILFKYYLSTENDRIKQSVNILGDLDYYNHTSMELIETLHSAGINNVTLIPGNCGINELKKASSASLNIITCINASRHLAQLFYDRFNIPFIGMDAGLFGIDGTYKTYCEIFDFLKLDKKMLSNKKEESKILLDPLIKKLNGKTAAIIGGTRRTLGYAQILKELGIEIKLIFSESDPIYTGNDLFLNYSKNVMVNEYPNDLIERIERENPDFLISTLPELVSPYKYINRTYEDFAGFDGTVRMANYLIEQIEKGDRLFIRINN